MSDINTLIEKIKAAPEYGTAIPVADLKALVAQFEARGQALEHYGDISNWGLSDKQVGDFDLYRPDDETLTHGWELARAALSKAEGQSSPWVAVGDRLPTVEGKYEVTTEHPVNKFREVDISWYSPPRNTDFVQNSGWSPGYVIAWRERPAPFTPSADTGEKEKISE